MSALQSCSWCHEINDVGAGATLCCGCGHRADVARADCDCSRCLPRSASDVTGSAILEQFARRGVAAQRAVDDLTRRAR